MRTITEPPTSSRRIRLGEPTSPASSGVIVAAFTPSPVRRMDAAAARTTSLAEARRRSRDRSNRSNEISNPITSGSSTRRACGVAHDRPPRWPREAMERMKTSPSVAWSCIRTRSPSSAPPVNGEDESTARTPTRLPRSR